MQVPQFRCPVRDRESTATPQNRTLTQSAAFGVTSEEAFQLIPLSCGPSRSSPARFFLLSFWAFFLSRAALALAFFTVSPDRVPRLCQSYKNQCTNGQGTFTGNKWLTARFGSSSHLTGQLWVPVLHIAFLTSGHNRNSTSVLFPKIPRKLQSAGLASKAVPAQGDALPATHSPQKQQQHDKMSLHLQAPCVPPGTARTPKEGHNKLPHSQQCRGALP